jgi:glycosyltransferase involved in cell wall biosynthesis
MKDTSIQFSVIIPTYNRGDMIVETLKSVLAQSKPVYEIIICDDGSTDDTCEHAEFFMNDNNIKFTLVKIENSGPSHARKVAVEHANGNWLCFLDSDDFWAPTYIEELLKITKHNEVECVITNFKTIQNNQVINASKFDDAPQNFWSDGFNKKENILIYNQDDLFLKTLCFQPAFPSAQAISKIAYEKSGGITLHSRTLKSEDSHFTRKLYLYCKVCFNNIPLVNIVIHKDNRSNSASGAIDIVGKLNGRLNILQLISQENILNNHPFHKKLENEINRSQVGVFNQYYWGQHYHEAINDFKKIPFLYYSPKVIIRYLIAKIKCS